MKHNKIFDRDKVENTWCPGCGDFGILNALKLTLTQLDIDPHEVTVVSGIGQAGKIPHYINTNGYNSLHGRSLPPAIGIKLANTDMKVVVNSGDGDTYGEGGNHFIHAIRRNIDIAHFVHDNQIYGLTKGQASPTTSVGHQTKIQPEGVISRHFDPISTAIVNGAGFVARSFSGDGAHLVELMKEAINYNGYALIDILQPCITFNKINTFKWYKDRIYKLGDDYDSSNRLLALEKASEWGDNIPVGVIYKRPEVPSYTDQMSQLNNGILIGKDRDPGRLESLLSTMQ
jgi:2-oxoglutarate ferredoxin oxidoreductase subunit beta